MFAQKGELYHNSNGQLVIWRPEYFRQVNVAICVLLANTIDTAFAGDADALQLGPFVDDDAVLKITVVWQPNQNLSN